MSFAEKVALVLEDDFLIAMGVAASLETLGFSVVGPFADIDKARDQCAEQSVDLVLLDINIRGRSSLPLALELVERGLNCVFVSGYARIPDLPEALAGVPLVPKPVQSEQLRQTIAAIIKA